MNSKDDMQLIRYIRKEHKGQYRPVGVVIAVLHDETIVVGYSKCHMKKDQFTKRRAVQIALDRIKVCIEEKDRLSRRLVSPLVVEDVMRMAENARKFFHKETVVIA